MKKYYKKIIIIALLALSVSAAAMSGCGRENNDIEVSSDKIISSQDVQIESKAESTSNIENDDSKFIFNIDDLSWKLEHIYYDSEDIVGLSYMNNSPYSIFHFELEMHVKKDLSKDQLKDLKEITDDPDPIVIASCNKFTRSKNMAIEGTCKFKYGDYLKKTEQLDFFDITSLNLNVIGNDGLIHNICYDFKTKKINELEDPEKTYQWSDCQLAKLLPKPNYDFVIIRENIQNSNKSFFGFEILDAVSTYKMEDYIDKCKEVGFTNDVRESNEYYRAKNKNGYELKITYYDDIDVIYVEIIG